MERKLNIIMLVGILFLVLSIGMLAYPTLSSMYIDSHQAKLELQYEEEVSNKDAELLAAEKEKAIEYNNAIRPGAKDINAFSKENQLKAANGYGDILNIKGDSIIGFIEIPKIDVNLPIFHGTDENILERGIGHLVGSSLPVGGIGTHSVLTGHSGMASKRLFSDLEDLVVGDMFYIHVLDETLSYRVDKIDVVLPHEMEGLTVESGKDYVTLVTCTPYSVNTHRLLVRGERVEGVNEENAEIGCTDQLTVAEDDMSTRERGMSTREKGMLTGVIYGICISAVLLLVVYIVYVIKKKK